MGEIVNFAEHARAKEKAEHDRLIGGLAVAYHRLPEDQRSEFWRDFYEIQEFCPHD